MQTTPARHWALLLTCIVAASAGLILSCLGRVDWTSPLHLSAWVLMMGGLLVLWSGGLRSLAMWLRARECGGASPPPRRMVAGSRVALLYCTADDFDSSVLGRSMRQRYPVDTLILDDSDDAAQRAEIDRFASASGAGVIRREDKGGFKAGNINHAMARVANDFDYVVILDSDTLLDADYVERALGVFAARPGAGIVQARIEASRGSTRFAAALAGLLSTHIRVTQAARDAIGFSHFLGRAGMVSTACFRAVGAVPEVVMEDVSFTLAARRAGFEVVYEPAILATEDYPIDYPAFRTQYRKMIEGGAELLLDRGRLLHRSGLRWWERIDLIWEHLHTAIASVAGVAVVGAGVLLAGDGVPVVLPLWATMLTSVLVVAPLLPEALRVRADSGVLEAVRFTVLGSALYGSMMVLSLRATARVLLGRSARFTVTPKRAACRDRGAARVLRAELVVASAAAGVALATTGSVLPVLPLLVPAIGALFLLFWGGGSATAHGDRFAPLTVRSGLSSD